MHEKTSNDILSMVQTELRKGKTKRQVADELNLSYYLVKKYGKGFVTSKRIPVELEQRIHQEAASGKTKRRGSKGLNLAYDTIYNYTADLGLTHYPNYRDFQPETIEKIREEVNEGKTKTQIAHAIEHPYSKIEKFARDTPINNEITKKKIEQIRREATQGKPKSVISLEMGVPYHQVMKYTRDITLKQTQPLPQEMINRIREMVKNGRPKLHVAKELQVSSWTVRKYTEDIPSKPHGMGRGTRIISSELIEKIRTSVKEGNTKRQTAKELDIPVDIVCKYTKDMPRRPLMTPRIYGKALILLKKLMKDGYAFSSPEYGLNEYQLLKKQFPSIYRSKQYGKIIYYLDDKAKFASKAFLETINKRIISYQEFNQIIKPFKTELEKEDKAKFIKKSRMNKIIFLKYNR